MNNLRNNLLQLFEAAERDNGADASRRVIHRQPWRKLSAKPQCLSRRGRAMPMIRRAFPEIREKIFRVIPARAEQQLSTQAASRTSKCRRLARKSP